MRNSAAASPWFWVDAATFSFMGRRLRKRLRASSSFNRCEARNEGNSPVELSVLGLVDNPHPAPAEFGEDLVVRDGLADHVG